MFSAANTRRKSRHENIFACLFSAHNTISLSCQEQVCLIRLFLRNTSPIIGLSISDGRSISQNLAKLNILIYDRKRRLLW